MRCLNEHIARQANLEDHCTGRFWEGRFKSQALLDEKALLSAMAYVDLNPIRAQMADTPERSDCSVLDKLFTAPFMANYSLLPAMRSVTIATATFRTSHIPYHLIDYIELVDWTGRQMRPHKKGIISERQPPILARLGLTPACWLHNCQQLETDFHLVIGPLATVQQFCQKLGQRWLHGQNACRRSFG